MGFHHNFTSSCADRMTARLPSDTHQVPSHHSDRSSVPAWPFACFDLPFDNPTLKPPFGLTARVPAMKPLAATPRSRCTSVKSPPKKIASSTLRPRSRRFPSERHVAPTRALDLPAAPCPTLRSHKSPSRPPSPALTPPRRRGDTQAGGCPTSCTPVQVPRWPLV